MAASVKAAFATGAAADTGAAGEAGTAALSVAVAAVVLGSASVGSRSQALEVSNRIMTISVKRIAFSHQWLKRTVGNRLQHEGGEGAGEHTGCDMSQPAIPRLNDLGNIGMLAIRTTSRSLSR